MQYLVQALERADGTIEPGLLDDVLPDLVKDPALVDLLSSNLMLSKLLSPEITLPHSQKC